MRIEELHKLYSSNNVRMVRSRTE